MKNVLDLPSAQPPGRVNNADRYASEQGYADSDPLVLSIREQFRRQHGVAPYVASCLGTMCPIGTRWLPARSKTALTDLLATEHDIALPITDGVWVFGQPLSSTSLHYLLRYTFDAEYSMQKPHLNLMADGHYEFVNLEAVKIPGLEGEANVAHVSEMEVVIAEDCIALLSMGSLILQDKPVSSLPSEALMPVASDRLSKIVLISDGFI